MASDDARLSALARASIDIILANQAPSGAYLASPAFPVYRYSWLRDGAFIADAMSRIGQVASADAFFGWCATTIEARTDRIDRLVARAAAGEAITASEHLHTRYTINGAETDDEWWNFQLDGYGAWLWALGAHHERHGTDVSALLPGALASARYVEAFWTEPSYDWWEEHRDHRHVSTLGAIGAGLRAVAALPGLDPGRAGRFAETAATIHETLVAEGGRLGYLPKWIGGDAVDASLLSIAVPFGLFAPASPLIAGTVQRIERDLVHDGGVHRYLEDTYYGGGEWLLLAAFLGLHYAAVGRADEARTQLEWIAGHAASDGALPEQVDDHLLAPSRRPEWLERWGPVASPLLWSHSMYLALADAVGIAVPAAAPT
jgi:GH15 family glucan-1,4-alpha-glucosidase